MITDGASRVNSSDACINPDGFGYASEGEPRALSTLLPVVLLIHKHTLAQCFDTTSVPYERATPARRLQHTQMCVVLIPQVPAAVLPGFTPSRPAVSPASSAPTDAQPPMTSPCNACSRTATSGQGLASCPAHGRPQTALATSTTRAPSPTRSLLL
jgi:hypothetical protein